MRTARLSLPLASNFPSRRCPISASTSPSPSSIFHPQNGRFASSSVDLARARASSRDPKELRSLFDRLGKTLGLKERDYFAWYNVSIVDLMKLEDHPLFEHSRYHLPTLLKSAYPEHKWNRKSFKYGSHYFPSEFSKEKLRLDLGKAGLDLGIKMGDLSAWYRVPYESIEKAIGHDRLGKFGFSRFKLFSTVYPEHSWHPWLFNKNQGTRMETVDALNKERFGRYLEQELGVTKPEDWYKVTKKDLAAIGLPDLFDNQADLIGFLRYIAPNVLWDQEKMAWSSFGWSHFHSALEQLFPTQVVSAGEFFGNKISQSDTHFERILVVPNAKLILEYQGPISYGAQILETRELLSKTISDLAMSLSKETSFIPIGIPFWWNRETNSLSSEIWRHSPDLFEPNGILAGWSSIASSSASIPDQVLRRDLNLNKSFIRSWADRFPQVPMKSSQKPIKPKLPSNRSMGPSVGPSLFLSPSQREILRDEFDKEPYPGRVHCEELASRLGLDVQKILNWFMKKRSISKGTF